MSGMAWHGEAVRGMAVSFLTLDESNARCCAPGLRDNPGRPEGDGDNIDRSEWIVDLGGSRRLVGGRTH